MFGKMAAFKMLASGERAFFSITTKCWSVKLYCTSRKNIIKELSKSLEKPKVPAPPFARFYKSVWPDYAHEVKKGVKNSEIIKQISKAWGQMSEKEKKKYFEEFEQDKVEYERKKELYKNSLTDEQKAIVKSLKKKINKSLSQDINPHSKDELQILNKPTRPLTPYLLFVKESFKEGKSTFPILASKWKNLPESEKQKYNKNFEKDMENYLKDLKNWEMKMFEEGNTDVLRTKTLKELSRKL